MFLDFVIVIYIEIECEIDIRTLTSHQVFGQILGQIFARFFDLCMSRQNRVKEKEGIRKYSVQVYWDRKYSVHYRKRLHANYFSLF